MYSQLALHTIRKNIFIFQLLSLKAEILRKQEDLTRTKQENAEKIKTIKKKSLELKNKGVDGRQLNDLDDAEQDLLKLSK